MMHEQTFWLVLTIAACCRIADGAVVFVDAPRGTVYIPPRGLPGKLVSCVTNEAATITWEYDDGRALGAARYNITQLTPTASAIYLTDEFRNRVPKKFTNPDRSIRCKAGAVSSSYFSFAGGELVEPPSNPVSLIIDEGENVVFSCTFPTTSRPSPKVYWVYEDLFDHRTELEESSFLTSLEHKTSQFRIRGANRTHVGMYHCVVWNEFNSFSSTPANLTVKYFYPVKLTARPMSTVAVGTIVTLVCSLSAVPPANEIRLSHNGVAFFSSSDSSVNKPTRGRITVNRQNHVEYRFTADLTWNASSFSVDVETSTNNDTASLVITVLDRPGQVTLSVQPLCTERSLKVDWKVSGNGGSDITDYVLRWQTDLSAPAKSTSLIVSSNPGVTQEGGNYVLTGLHSDTMYHVEVEAQNGVGSVKSKSISARTVAVLATPVLEEQPMSATEETLEIKWNMGPDGSNKETKYTVMFSNDATTVEQSSQTQTSATTLTLSGLLKGAEYFVKVKARNNMCTTDSSVQRYVTRCYPGKPSPPAVVRETPRTNTVQLIVKPPSGRDCGDIIDFYVRDASTNDRLKSTYSIEKDNVTITVDDLPTETLCMVQVSAVNSRNLEGPRSQPVTCAVGKVEPIEEDDSGVPIVVIIVPIVIVLLIIILIIIVCCIFWRRRRDEEDDEDRKDTTEDYFKAAELGTKGENSETGNKVTGMSSNLYESVETNSDNGVVTDPTPMTMNDKNGVKRPDSDHADNDTAL